MAIYIFGAAVVGLVFYTWKVLNPGKEKILQAPQKWKDILNEEVHFYQNLNEVQKAQFESDIRNFLEHVPINGAQVDITLEDRLLVAASAVIPLFGFPQWTYNYLDEVILYPGLFDEHYNIGGPNARMSGMVGNGPMEGKVILSKPALHRGFDINNDMRNVGIHEFAHLFDKEDGEIDGIPPGFHDKMHSIPWMALIKKKTDEIKKGHSNIDEYAAYNEKEFFAVASEYFFERPHQLEDKEPELYKLLTEVFHQDPTNIIDEHSYKKPKEIPRNAKCPCGSGKKYKDCCMK